MFDYITIEKIVNEQAKDPTLRPLIDRLMTREDHQDGVYKLYNSQLTKRRNMHVGFSATNVVIVAPRSLWGDLISYFHVLSAHAGARRLNTLMSSYYYLPGSLAKCQQYCKGCYCCQLVQPSKRPRDRISGPERGQYPGDLYAIDHFKMAKQGHLQYLLAVVDTFSGYLQVYPCSTLDEQNVAKSLKQCFASVGPPARIKSDAHKSLLHSSKVREVISGFGFNHIHI